MTTPTNELMCPRCTHPIVEHGPVGCVVGGEGWGCMCQWPTPIQLEPTELEMAQMRADRNRGFAIFYRGRAIELNEQLGKAREITEIIRADNTVFISYDKTNGLIACEAIHRAVIETCDDILATLPPAPEVKDVPRSK